MIHQSNQNSQAMSTESIHDEVAQNTLLGLSPELRNQIYEHVLCEREGHDINIKKWPPKVVEAWHEPGLLRVCKQIRREVLTLYYSSNSFVLRPRTKELEKACDWLRARSSAVEGPLKVKFFVPLASWRELPSFIHVAHLFRETEIELSPGWSADRFGILWESLFESESKVDGVRSGSLKEVIDMGRAAREEGLTQGELADRFGDWLNMEESSIERLARISQWD